jgi:hypothetical protein
MFGFKLCENKETGTISLELWELNNNTEKETLITSLLIINKDIEYVRSNLDEYKKELVESILKYSIDFQTTIMETFLNK